MNAARLLCAALAIVVAAWFALGARQAINTSRATAIANRGAAATAADERDVRSLVNTARQLNPDQQPTITLGQVEVEHHDFARARRLLEPVTRAEPQNLQGWLWLAHASTGEPALLHAALLHLRALDPRALLH